MVALKTVKLCLFISISICIYTISSAATETVFDFELDHRYRLHTTPKKWLDANKVCLMEHSYLAVINSEHEANTLTQTLSMHSEITGSFDNSPVFVGLSNQVVNGIFTTIQGIPVEHLGYNVWAAGQPDMSMHCAGMSRDGRMTSLPCQKPARFFCEKPLRLQTCHGSKTELNENQLVAWIMEHMKKNKKYVTRRS